MSNGNFFGSEFFERETANVASFPEHNDMPEKNFRNEICTNEVDWRNVIKENFAADKIVLVPNSKVVGKGIDRELDICAIFIQAGDRRYACNFLPDSGHKYSDIPQDTMFIVLGDADAVYVILKDEDGGNSAYLLGDDVTVSIFFYTKQDRFGSRFYGCAVRDMETDFCHTLVTANPNASRFLFKIFAQTTKIDQL